VTRFSAFGLKDREKERWKTVERGSFGLWSLVSGVACADFGKELSFPDSTAIISQ
jgi:hypothetical protein